MGVLRSSVGPTIRAELVLTCRGDVGVLRSSVGPTIRAEWLCTQVDPHQDQHPLVLGLVNAEALLFSAPQNSYEPSLPPDLSKDCL